LAGIASRGTAARDEIEMDASRGTAARDEIEMDASRGSAARDEIEMDALARDEIDARVHLALNP
jgi:hypothetical protein